MTSRWSWPIVEAALPHLLAGLWVTILATLAGMALAMVLGLLLAMMRRSAQPMVSWSAAGAVEFIRSTPLLIQLFLVFYLVPDWGWNTPLITGALVLGIHYSAYLSEVYRAGIQAVARGQWEAAAALGLSRRRMWMKIVLPQAVPPVVPAIGNYFVAMFKDTPLLYAITVREMMGEATIFSSRAGSYVESYTLVGILFLAVSLGAAWLIRRCEGWLNRLGR